MKHLYLSVMSWLKSSKWLLLLLIGLLALFWARQQGDLTTLSQWFAQDQLHQSNHQYLEEVRSELGTELGHLLELEAIVDVASSSQFGISFIFDMNVEVGRLLTSLSEILDRGTEVVVVSLTAVGLLDIVSELMVTVSPWLLDATLVFLAVWCAGALFHRPLLENETCHRTLNLLSRLFLFAWLVVPYSLHFNQVASQAVDHYVAEKSGYQYFSDMATELRGAPKHGDLKERAKDGVKLLHKAVSSKLHQKVVQSSHVVMQRAAQMILNLLVMPLVLLVALYYLLCHLLPWPGLFQRTAVRLKSL